MELGLKGKNAAISGSSQGVGYAIAMALADEGCNIAFSARGRERLDKAVKDAEAKGVKAVGVLCDLSSSEGCQKFVAEAVAGLGGLDILVNCVGGMVPGNLDTLTDEQWGTVINTNLMPYVWASKYAVEHLKKSKSGRILNVSGVTGKQVMPGPFSTTIPNTAIIGLNKLLAAELGASNILVNSICPGFTATESWVGRAEAMAKVRGVSADDVRKGIASQNMLGRWAEPAEIGRVAAFMVSEANSYMTGANIEVDGGYTKYF
jgi:3-oxoacyl-[acyl-carrier protein] reductase